MKIKINYDLFEKMEEAKKGFSLTRLTKRVCIYSSLSMLIGMPLNMALSLPFEQNFKDLLTYVPLHILFRIPEALLFKMFQPMSVQQLKVLVSSLRKINVNTDFQMVWTDAVRKLLEENKEVYDPRKVIGAGEEAIKNKVKEKIEVFNTRNS